MKQQTILILLLFLITACKKDENNCIEKYTCDFSVSIVTIPYSIISAENPFNLIVDVKYNCLGQCDCLSPETELCLSISKRNIDNNYELLDKSTIKVPSFESCKSWIENVEIKFIEAGEFIIEVSIDCNNEICEQNEANNTFKSEFLSN